MANSNTEHGFDPGREHLGDVYAKALLGATEKAKSSDAVVAELESLVVDVLDKMPELDDTLASLRLPHDDKVRLLDKAFAGRMTPQLLDFLKVLSRHNRLDSLRAILRAARRQLNELRGRVEVLVTSAAPLNNQLLEQIQNKLTTVVKREVILKTKVDPDLLGGLVIRIGDKVYDSSLAMQLRGMRDQALAKAEQQIRESSERFISSSA